VGIKLVKSFFKGFKQVYADGGYDGTSFRQAVEEIGAEPMIPPPKGAIIDRKTKDEALIKRNRAVKEIKGLEEDAQSRKLWKKLKGYHRRFLVETAMYRIKQLTGSQLKSREWERQEVEAYLKYLVVNKMSKLGMPRGIWKEAI
jgi:transposase